MDAHAMSIVTNSCVSLPRDPETKLAATFSERTLRNEEYANNDEEAWRWYEERSKTKTNLKPNVTVYNSNQCESSVVREDMADCDESWGEREADLLASLESDSGHLSDDEFFSKLQEARKAHRENLQLLEHAYNEKLRMETAPMARSASKQSLTWARGAVNFEGDTSEGTCVTDHDIYHIGDRLEDKIKSRPNWSALNTDNTVKDVVRDMSAQKPPSSGKPRRAWQRETASPGNFMRNPLAFNNEWSDITWTSDSDMETSSQSAQQSRHEELTNSTLSLSKQPNSPAVIVDNMWDNFSVDGYAPRTRTESKLSSQSMGTTSSGVRHPRTEWSPKITIPKPFKMTRREAQKEKTVSRASAEIDAEIQRRQIEEEAECRKQFKAKPVPATTFIPLYEDLKEKQTERSREIRLQSKQKLKEIQKPFKFEEREEKRKNDVTKKFATPPPKQSRTPKFKARKVPKSVFDSDTDQRILEEEEYRKIRIKMRAEEMLRLSSLPPNMEVRSKHYTDGKQRRKNMKKKEKQAFFTDEHKFHPQINGVIPDYEEQHRRFQEEVRVRKQEREPTVVEPFNLRTARIPSKREKILAELRAEEERRKEEMRGYHTLRSSQNLSIADDVIPIKTTSSAILRKSITDKTLLERAEQERLQEEKKREKQLRQKNLRQAVAKKARAHDASQSLEAMSKEKMKQFRESEKAREKEYERELQEMMARIESRPLLFERESQHNAQKRAERQYIDALRSAGLDEGFLERQSRSPRGVSVKVTREDDRESNSTDEDLAILKQTGDDPQDTYDLDSRSSGSFSSEREGSAT